MRINGQSFEVRLGDYLAHVESFTLDIEDGGEEAMTNGRPDGWLAGDKKAGGEIVLDIRNFALFSAQAAAAGSWEELPPFNINTFGSGSAGNIPELMHVLAHECKITLSSVLNIDPTTTEKSKVTLPYRVTGRDFVHINGTPYTKNSAFNLI